ncbi:MAG: LysM peptidoglycan-binding domain-containing protein [Angustibacter sp.]
MLTQTPIRGQQALVAPPPGLRLTRRGRVALAFVVTVSAVALWLASAPMGTADIRVNDLPVRYVTVGPGETLWGIVGELAPSDDPRDVIARIIELNALTTTNVQVGQRIAVPHSSG